MGNTQTAEECPLCDEDLSLEAAAHRTVRVLAKTARRQNDRLEAAEAAGAAALALAERYAAAEAVAVAASEASRAEANRLRQSAAGAHKATTRRLTEVTRRLVQETEERHEAVRAENNGLRSENEKLRLVLQSVMATPDYWHAFRQHWLCDGAKALDATTPALADTEQHQAAEAANAAAFEAKCAEADELRSENEELKRELESAREKERLAEAREAKRKLARDRASVKAAETERRRAENLAAKAEAVRREQERTLLKQHAAARAAVLAAAAGEETAHAEANRLQSENERLKLEIESVVATPDYWHAFRQHWKRYGAKSLGATTPALADAEQHHAAEAASAAAFEAKCAEADELRSEIERLKLELDQERERTAAARAAAVERSSVGDEGVEESKSETQARSTRVSFDAAEKISVVESTPVEGETGSRASSPKRKKSAWLCGGARAVTPPPSSRSSHVVSYDESDGGRRSRPHQVQYLRSYREPSRSPSRDEDYGDSICGFASFTSASYTSASYTSARSSREAFISRYDPYANRDITQDYGF